jgi:hypothetical protein
MTLTRHQARIALIDAHVQSVAALLPFPVELDADMGGTFTLHIDLGTRGDPDDPPDTAGIDPDPANGPLVWWFDVAGGETSIISTHTLDTPPETVAAWITVQARQANSPAARPTDKEPS